MDERIWKGLAGWKAEWSWISEKIIISSGEVSVPKYIMIKSERKSIANLIYRGWSFKNIKYGSYKPGSIVSLRMMAELYGNSVNLRVNLDNLSIKFSTESYNKLEQFSYEDLFNEDRPRALLKNIFYQWFIDTTKSHEYLQATFENSMSEYNPELDVRDTKDEDMNTVETTRNEALINFIKISSEDELALIYYKLGTVELLDPTNPRKYILPVEGLISDKTFLKRWATVKAKLNAALPIEEGK